MGLLALPLAGELQPEQRLAERVLLAQELAWKCEHHLCEAWC
jgi:hypothetical protein